ncbi:uncharacterized protein B0H18DRAFT_956916 [Fomitopsis serialis]|uniref:uncharacterized protein n=1 Tax=Fomitopsis serialis TaxID=139415 RepID=UPI00200864D8|nr:uncharacterized protein B0H18DRAFT_956916 [Neoantrodia serialis]KAH9920785.1 hypothetical protein B0H18DRAFT_956916 [Neoantrodia serialis]
MDTIWSKLGQGLDCDSFDDTALALVLADDLEFQQCLAASILLMCGNPLFLVQHFFTILCAWQDFLGVEELPTEWQNLHGCTSLVHQSQRLWMGLDQAHILVATDYLFLLGSSTDNVKQKVSVVKASHQYLHSEDLLGLGDSTLKEVAGIMLWGEAQPQLDTPLPVGEFPVDPIASALMLVHVFSFHALWYRLIMIPEVQRNHYD